MTAATLLSRARTLGATFALQGDRLKVRAPAPLPDDLLASLRQHKPSLLALLSPRQQEVPDPSLLQAEEVLFRLWWQTISDKALARQAFDQEVHWYCSRKRLALAFEAALTRLLADLEEG